jgi:hypothetical protein
MSTARKLRRREQLRAQSAWDAPLRDDDLEFARRVVAWQHSADDSLADLAARTIRAAMAAGASPLACAVTAHVATCNSGGELGSCEHSDEEVTQLLPGADETRRWVQWLKSAAAAVLVVLAFCWPSAAKAAQDGSVFALGRAHKIQRRNWAGLLLKLRTFRHHFRRRGWIQSRNYYATSRRRSLSCLVFATGCAREHASSRRRARRSKLSWCGGSGAFASGVCRASNPTSRLNVPTARSSARRGASQAKGAANANA